MTPITSHVLAQVHMGELRRQAEQYRLTSHLRPANRMPTRIRSATGSWLIKVGERLLPRPHAQSAGC
jgi:hypothetical protein